MEVVLPEINKENKCVIGCWSLKPAKILLHNFLVQYGSLDNVYLWFVPIKELLSTKDVNYVQDTIRFQKILFNHLVKQYDLQNIVITDTLDDFLLNSGDNAIHDFLRIDLVNVLYELFVKTGLLSNGVTQVIAPFTKYDYEIVDIFLKRNQISDITEYINENCLNVYEEHPNVNSYYNMDKGNYADVASKIQNIMHAESQSLKFPLRNFSNNDLEIAYKKTLI